MSLKGGYTQVDKLLGTRIAATPDGHQLLMMGGAREPSEETLL